MKNRKTKARLAVLCESINILAVAWCVSRLLAPVDNGGFGMKGGFAFMMFTTDSNILSAAAGVCLLPAILSILRSPEKPFPRWCSLLRLAGTEAVAVTFLTVMLFLGPTVGYAPMLQGTNIYMHVFGPLLSMAAFLLEASEPLKKRDFICGALPVFVYGLVYFYEVLIIGVENGGWFDIYGFNAGGMWYVSLPVMFLAAVLLALVLIRVYNRAAARAGR